MSRRVRRLLGISSALPAFVAGASLLAYQVRRTPEVLAWYVVIPLVFVALAKFVFFGGGDAVSVGVYPPGSWASEALSERGFEVVEYESLEALEKDLSRGSVAAGVLALGDGVRVVYASSRYEGVAWGVAASLTGGWGRSEGPASVEVLPVESFETPEREIALYTVNLVGMQALYLALYSGIATLVSMKRDGSLKLLASSPGGGVALASFLAGYSLAAMALSAVAIVAGASALGADFSGLRVEGVTAALILIPLSAVSVFLASIPVSLAIRTEEAAAAISGVIGFIAIFAAGIVVPRESLPWPLSEAAAYFPLTAAIEASREALAGDASLMEAAAEAAPVYIALALAALIGVRGYRMLVSRALEE